MNPLDPMGELLRFAERYRRMSDGELRALMPQTSELTAIAQQALATEVRQRGLKLEDTERETTESQEDQQSGSSASDSSLYRKAQLKSPLADENNDNQEAGGLFLDDDHPPSESYEDDRKLVDLCTVYSVRDALQLQTILDDLGIPFFMGPEKATGVDLVTSNFSSGVNVQIMKIGMSWVYSGMKRYEPEDDPTPKEDPGAESPPVRCPRCHSVEVVFEGLDHEPTEAEGKATGKFEWQCDSCGNRWEDDGVVKE
jgi:hypothetical protein